MMGVNSKEDDFLKSFGHWPFGSWSDPQTIEDKHENIKYCKEIIDKMESALKQELAATGFTNIQIARIFNTKQDASARNQSIKNLLKRDNLTPRAKRMVNIIVDSCGVIEREEQAIAILSKHNKSIHDELNNVRAKMEWLKHTGKQYE